MPKPVLVTTTRRNPLAALERLPGWWRGRARRTTVWQRERKVGKTPSR